MEVVAQALDLSVAEVSRKLHNLRCQMNSKLRKIKNKKSGIVIGFFFTWFWVWIEIILSSSLA